MAKTTDIQLRIGGMHCASCVSSIEQDLSGLEGVDDIRVNLATGSARVLFDSGRVDEAAIVERIRQLGFEASPGKSDPVASHARELNRARRNLTVAIILAAPLMIIAMWPMVSGDTLVSRFVDGVVQAVLAAAILLWAGRGIMADAWQQTRHFRANMNSLIAMGTLTAFGWSVYALTEIAAGGREDLFFESAGMIIALILVGRYFEARAKGQASSAIQELIKLRPSNTIAIINGVEVEIEAATAQPDMILLVKPGERVPADGEIVEGSPTIDESMLTGESVPVEKRPGDEVIGGSLNSNVPFKLKVTRKAEDSFLSNVIRLVSEAQSNKAPVQKLADKVAGIFVPIVILLALITLGAWLWLAPDSPILIKSVISVLIIACPCALGLATPTAVLAGTGRAAKAGIIIKGGDVLEKLAEVDTVIFDKTGTLTHGDLHVSGVRSFGPTSEQSLIRLIGSLESQSEHPVANAIVQYMKDRHIEPAVVRNVESKPGFGLIGESEGRQLIVGNRSLMEKQQVTFGPSLLPGEQEMEKGRTVVYAALDGQVIGMISLADRVRGDARELIETLKKSGHRVAMISGDNRRTAEGVAKSLGIDQFEAEIRPEQKKLIVESYRRAGFKVAMVGDGINDAPALAEANVGVAVGSGTDVAIETAGVVISRSELDIVDKMFRLSKESLRIIKQNLFWAFFYNVVAIPIAAGALYPIMGLTLSPMIAAAAMSFSSVFVVTNSLRLHRFDL